MPENQTEITLGLLSAVEENHNVTQRLVAKDLGIALGLVNSYLKRCIKKGYVKIRHAPANRYSYYLTPAGFSEKSRLTTEYLSTSFNFFRNARKECAFILRHCEEFGHNKVIMAGVSDLSEIVFLCAQENWMEILGTIDHEFAGETFLNRPVFPDLEAVGQFDAVIITSLSEPQTVYDRLVSSVPSDRIYTPSFLGISRPANADRPGVAP